MKKTAGFTLMELMVVIAIIAILSSIAIPGYIGWIPKHKLSSAARSVLSALEIAKSRAVKDNEGATVVFDTIDNTYTATAAGGQSLKSGKLPEGVRFGSVAFTPGGVKQVQFNSQGFADKTGTVELINQKGAQKTVEVTIAGNVRIQ